MGKAVQNCQDKSREILLIFCVFFKGNVTGHAFIPYQLRGNTFLHEGEETRT